MFFPLLDKLVIIDIVPLTLLRDSQDSCEGSEKSQHTIDAMLDMKIDAILRITIKALVRSRII